MTANQQLKDYIVEQTKLGVSKDTVKSALLEAGWKEGDISQAVAEAESRPQEMASLKPTLPIQPVEQAKPLQSAQQTQPFQPAKPSEISQESKPVSMSGFSNPTKKDSPVPFITSDIFQPKGESVFQSSGAKSQTPSNSPETKPQVISIKQNNKSGAGTIGGKILSISLVVVSIILLGGNVYFFLQNSALQTQLNVSKQENVSFSSQLSSLANDKNSLTGQITSLNQTISDLDNQLSLYTWPSNVSQTQELPVTIKGILGGGGRALYFLTTNKSLMVNVKNSKDLRVDEVLKPLLGTQVEVSGTHLVKSDSVTVTTVNGASLPLLQSVSTSTPKTATSTSGGASTSTSP